MGVVDRHAGPPGEFHGRGAVTAVAPEAGIRDPGGEACLHCRRDVLDRDHVVEQPPPSRRRPATGRTVPPAPAALYESARTWRKCIEHVFDRSSPPVTSRPRSEPARHVRAAGSELPDQSWMSTWFGAPGGRGRPARVAVAPGVAERRVGRGGAARRLVAVQARVDLADGHVADDVARRRPPRSSGRTGLPDVTMIRTCQPCPSTTVPVIEARSGASTLVALDLHVAAARAGPSATEPADTPSSSASASAARRCPVPATAHRLEVASVATPPAMIGAARSRGRSRERAAPPLEPSGGPVADDLFSAAVEERLSGRAPLAARLRPRSLDEVVGQDALLAPGKPLRVLSSRTGWRRWCSGDRRAPARRRIARLVAGATAQGLRAAVGGDRGGQGRARGRRAGAGPARRARPGHDPVPRRGPPVQPHPAGRAAAPRRGGPARPGRARPRRTRSSRSPGRCCRARRCSVSRRSTARRCARCSNGRSPIRERGLGADGLDDRARRARAPRRPRRGRRPPRAHVARGRGGARPPRPGTRRSRSTTPRPRCRCAPSATARTSTTTSCRRSSRASAARTPTPGLYWLGAHARGR